MKRTTDFQWAHINCALWIPEVFFHDADGRDYIDYYRIPQERWHKECSYCKSTDGCCMRCSSNKCETTFHVSCGVAHNVISSYSTISRCYWSIKYQPLLNSLISYVVIAKHTQSCSIGKETGEEKLQRIVCSCLQTQKRCVQLLAKMRLECISS